MQYVDCLNVFVRSVDLGSITSGGRDLRLTPAVASKRIKELEAHLGVRLLNRTTRSLTPTEIGKVYYDHARSVLESIRESEAAVAGFSSAPRGTISVVAPLGVGRRLIAPLVPEFVAQYPEVNIRLRLSDRKVDMLADNLDLAIFLGELRDSNLKFRKIASCERVLCASPKYLASHGHPKTPGDLLRNDHNCLLLRYPRSPEYFWTLQGRDGPERLEVAGRYDADDGDVLTRWAEEGWGIANKPRFDVAEALANGSLVEVLPDTPPVSATLGCLYPHRRLQDPKIRLFLDFAVMRLKETLFAGRR
ncbi:LysR family transcriptional regulator [Aliiruegeria haliotis]|uniref:LysR family transcriptional regulator n=1 Tax=Aliiruegeria haliotis TaxID=1280846 RepID=A0A2T0RM17_9RHOB|nr:LysR family transcriptional regulator [Aliiruegeria haliotis]PRY22229.1 LysR family transcriptional regulator [Aliiruegeria haliotis]